jgi:phosphoribosylamine--glycine ligase
MTKYNIPTAKYVEVDSYDQAVNSLKQFDYPVVVKADGLAAGKGVVICQNYDEAVATLQDFLLNSSLGEAGHKVVLEEFLTGFEASLLCFVDNNTIVPMVSVKDHKQIYDNNLGPNTGGMGTVSPNPFMPEGLESVFEETILNPFMNGLKSEGIDYRGVIFIGLMIENNVAKVLEYNVRFGDPETQSLMLRLDSDLFEIMYSVATNTLTSDLVKFNNDHVACLVLSSAGYPGSYEKGKVITGLDEVEDVIVFHAGTKEVDGAIVTNGGRVLNICALGKDLDETRAKVYKASEIIDFDGKYFRTDIGLM